MDRRPVFFDFNKRLRGKEKYNQLEIFFLSYREASQKRWKCGSQRITIYKRGKYMVVESRPINNKPLDLDGYSVVIRS